VQTHLAPPGTFTEAEARGLRQVFGQGPADADLLDQLARGPSALPPGVTLRTLQKYATIARAAITGGIDKIGTQALRL
jgi:hypothetical protein